MCWGNKFLNRHRVTLFPLRLGGLSSPPSKHTITKYVLPEASSPHFPDLNVRRRGKLIYSYMAHFGTSGEGGDEKGSIMRMTTHTSIFNPEFLVEKRRQTPQAEALVVHLRDPPTLAVL